MPKMKTRKAIVARFKVTGTGKLKRQRPGKRHILTKKTTKRKNKLGKPTLVDKTQVVMYKKMMCM